MTRFKRIASAVAAALASHALLLVCLAPGSQRPNKGHPLQVRLLRMESAANLKHPTAERADAVAIRDPATAAHKRVARARPEVSALFVPRTDRTGPPSGIPRLSLVLKALPDSGTEAHADGADQRLHAEDIAEQKAILERRIDGWVADAKAAQRVEVSDVYWREAATVLEQGFRPGSDILERNATNTRAAADRNPNLPASGNSLNDDLVALPNEARGLESVSLGGAPRPGISLGNIVGLIVARSQRRLSAVVSIAHREDGGISAVTLTAGSGNAAYDRLALDKARLLNRARSREGRVCRSVWTFETVFTTIPTNTVRSQVRLAALY